MDEQPATHPSQAEEQAQKRASAKARKREGAKARKREKALQVTGEGSTSLAEQKVSKKRAASRSFNDGNYDRYYGYRKQSASNNLEAWTDPRLDLVRAEWFIGCNVLDIGCNVGQLSVEIARRFGAKHMIGIDIDESLVAKARLLLRQRSDVFSRPGGCGCESSNVASSAELPAPTTRVSVEFKALDLISGGTVSPPPPVPPANSLPPGGTELFDTICCFSVTKWVHLNQGDDGLKELFRVVYAMLGPGGRFVLEPQPWRSYKKKYWDSNDLMRSNYKAIQLRPKDFADYLTGTVGFRESEMMAMPKGVERGFRRPIYVFTK